jgi:Tfp pilus assembly protein PilF
MNRVTLGLVLCLCIVRAATAAAPAPVEWEAVSTAGKPVRVPLKDQPTVILFFKAQQTRSLETLEQLKPILADKTVQVLAVISGKEAVEQAKAMVEQTQWPWPVVIDPEYNTSGKMSVRVWPTTLVIRGDGMITGHLAGASNAFAKDLESHLEFAAGRIDEAELKTRLESHEVVGSKSEHAAARHERVALRLLERHQVQGAHDELTKALAELPGDPTLIQLMARTKLLLNQPQEALDWLKKLDEVQASASGALTTRGRALLALGKRDQAIESLTAALKLNPAPAEAQYALGQAYEAAGDSAKAAAAYRAAFEATEEARRITAEK